MIKTISNKNIGIRNKIFLFAFIYVAEYFKNNTHNLILS